MGRDAGAPTRLVLRAVADWRPSAAPGSFRGTAPPTACMPFMTGGRDRAGPACWWSGAGQMGLQMVARGGSRRSRSGGRLRSGARPARAWPFRWARTWPRCTPMSSPPPPAWSPVRGMAVSTTGGRSRRTTIRPVLGEEAGGHVLGRHLQVTYLRCSLLMDIGKAPARLSQPAVAVTRRSSANCADPEKCQGPGHTVHGAASADADPLAAGDHAARGSDKPVHVNSSRILSPEAGE